MGKGTPYVAKIKVPKNCYFCKNLSWDSAEAEYTSEFFSTCNKKGDFETKVQRDGDVDSFEKNMKF